MPMDYYNDGPTEAPAKPMDKGKAEGAQDEQHDERDEKTALLPKSVLGGKEFKPGDELVLEVVQTLEDEVLVKYASGKDEGEGEDGGAREEQPEPTGRAGAMNSFLE